MSFREEVMSPSQAEEIVARMKFDADGLIPAIVQDASTRQILTVAYMNRETAKLSLTRGRDLVLEPQPPGDLAQGGDLRKHPEDHRDPPGL